MGVFLARKDRRSVKLFPAVKELPPTLQFGASGPDSSLSTLQYELSGIRNWNIFLFLKQSSYCVFHAAYWCSASDNTPRCIKVRKQVSLWRLTLKWWHSAICIVYQGGCLPLSSRPYFFWIIFCYCIILQSLLVLFYLLDVIPNTSWFCLIFFLCPIWPRNYYNFSPCRPYFSIKN